MCGVDLDLHKTNNFAPNEFRGVVNSSGLVIYKGSNARDKNVLVKVKDWKVNCGANNDVNMDRGPVIFTSDVSLPKYGKSASEVNKLQRGNWQDYEGTAVLIMLQERKGSEAMGKTPK